MPTLATPRWNGKWNGDSGSLLDAAEAASDVLDEADIEMRTSISIDWGDGAADEDSIADGRAALSRDANAPKRLEVSLLSMSDEPGVASVLVAGFSGVVLVTARGEDFALTQRVFGAAQELAASAATSEADPPGAATRVGGQRAHFSRERTWKQWAGSLLDLAGAASLAADELAAWDPNHEDEHGWGVETEITIRERNGLTTKFGDPTELPTAVDPRDLANLTRVVIDVSRLKPRSRVTIIGESSSLRNGMEVMVGGEDRTRVEGLMRRLDDLLVPRERLGLLLNRSGWLISAVGLFWVGLLAVGFPLKYAFGVPPETRIAVAAAAGAALALAAGLFAWASPPLEVLPPGRKPQYQRCRAKVLAVVGALVIGVIASVIATVIYSGD